MNRVLSENLGPAIGAAGLTVFAVAVFAVKAGALDAVVAAALPSAGAVGAIALLGLLLAGQGSGRATGRAAGGRSIAVHGHAHGGGGMRTRRTIARHEAGHVAAARALGGQVVSAEVYPGASGGLVQARLPGCGPGPSITFLRAGRYAAGTSRGAAADMAMERALLREVPRTERDALSRECDRDARRIVSTSRGAIRRDERTLERTGSL